LLNKFVPGIADAKTHFYTSEPQKAHASTARSLLHPPYTFGTLALWLTLFAGLFCVYLLSSWLPLMVRDTGMTLSQAVIMGSVFQIGGMMGNFCIGIEMDRWGRHCAIILTLLGRLQRTDSGDAYPVTAGAMCSGSDARVYRQWYQPRLLCAGRSFLSSTPFRATGVSRRRELAVWVP
jgi:MFS family permease